MTIKVGNQYIHTVLGYVNDSGVIVITEDPELATMTGKYKDGSAVESTNPAVYAWEEINVTDSDEGEDEGAELDEESDSDDLLFRLADTQKTESIQENLVVGTNQGADGWQAGEGTIEAVVCNPDDNGTTVNGVRWAATANDTLARTADIPGEAVPESVTVSFWWNASAPCGLTASVGANTSEKQYNYDSADLDEDGNALDLSGAWLFFEALIPISTEADGYQVKMTVDSAATIDICDFKIEAGDKATEWTASAKEVADKLDGLTLIKEGAVYIDGGKIYVDEAFVNSIFAQDITATGTISGLKLRGSEIDVESTTTEMMMEAGDVRITGNEIHLSSKLVSIAADDLMLDVPCYKNLYTTFDSDVVSSGTVLVVEKMGWCAVTAIVELSSAVSGWTDILTVPAPQHGRNLYTTVPANNSTTIKPLSARIASAGKLQLRYGGAGTYYFELAYPIE